MSDYGCAHADIHAELADRYPQDKQEGACEAPYVGWEALEEHGCLGRHKVCIDQVDCHLQKFCAPEDLSNAVHDAARACTAKEFWADKHSLPLVLTSVEIASIESVSETVRYIHVSTLAHRWKTSDLIERH